MSKERSICDDCGEYGDECTCGPVPSASGPGSPSFHALRTIPRGPWLASQQYGHLQFILSQDNEIIFKCGDLPFDLVKAMVNAANGWMKENTPPCGGTSASVEG